MKAAPTLIDTLYQLTFNKQTVPGWRSNQLLRERLVAARRFMLDDQMSAFLADLSLAAFKRGATTRVTTRGAEQLRISARSPHRIVWIEYNLRAELTRLRELVPSGAWLNPPVPSEAPTREGWLIEQHPHLDYAFRMHLFCDSTDEPDPQGFDTWTFPFVYCWSTTDDPLPWKIGPEPALAQMFLGVPGYFSDKVGLTDSDLIRGLHEHAPEIQSKMADLIKEWAGLMRRVWALLATINDLPMLAVDVRASKGFMGRGMYRKYLNHRLIRLNVPARADVRKIARNLVAIARRRAHQVRGHWRKDWRHPGNARCQHIWTTDNRCEHCEGHRLWIAEHQRGDATLGLVLSNYEVTHEVP